MTSYEQPAAYTTSGLTLRNAFSIFMRYANARMIAVVLAAAAVLRLALGGWHTSDLIVAGIILGLQPFTEWVIHVTVLHLRPFTVRGRRFDLYIAKRHRDHHQDPKVIRHVTTTTPL